MALCPASSRFNEAAAIFAAEVAAPERVIESPTAFNEAAAIFAAEVHLLGMHEETFYRLQ